jgi:hypothetical protein
MAAVKLGLRYADGSVRGANARCIAMLQTFVQCIQVRVHTSPPKAPLGQRSTAMLLISALGHPHTYTPHPHLSHSPRLTPR